MSSTSESVTRHRLALAVLATGLLVSVVLGSMPFLGLIREQLHYLCGFHRMGGDDPGSFYCADGISYIAPGVVTYGVLLVLTLCAVIANSLDDHPTAARWLTISSILPPIAIIGLTVLAASQRSLDGAPGANYWVVPMLPASVVLAVGSAMAITACFVDGPARRPLLWAALGLAVFAAVVQPGILPATAVECAILIAAVLRSPPPCIEDEAAVESPRAWSSDEGLTAA